MKFSAKASARKPQKIPLHISPMRAVLSEMPEDDSAYAFEFKWDGYRTICLFDGRRLRLESRNQLDLTARFPEISALAGKLPYPVILDGEMVAMDAAGRPDFGLLQKRTELFSQFLGKKTSGQIRITYLIFDLLYDQNQMITDLTFRERRERLERLPLRGEKWRLSPVYYGVGKKVFDIAQNHHLEGIVAKRITSVYEEGRRSRAWKKIKIVQSQEFVICGWQEGNDGNDGGLGSLLLGYYEKGRLRYAGNVGTGFSHGTRAVLTDYMKRQGNYGNPFGQKIDGKNIHFIKPELAADVEFRGWTADAKVRQASFKGIRIDKDLRTIIRERKETN